jgi:hypothetical protein
VVAAAAGEDEGSESYLRAVAFAAEGAAAAVGDASVVGVVAVGFAAAADVGEYVDEADTFLVGVVAVVAAAAAAPAAGAAAAAAAAAEAAADGDVDLLAEGPLRGGPTSYLHILPNVPSLNRPFEGTHILFLIAGDFSLFHIVGPGRRSEVVWGGPQDSLPIPRQGGFLRVDFTGEVIGLLANFARVVEGRRLEG